MPSRNLERKYKSSNSNQIVGSLKVQMDGGRPDKLARQSRVARRIDVNCDMGESYGNFRIGDDEKIMLLITSANVACGFHGGDPVTMERNVGFAKQNGVGVGSHPGLPDLMGFGRREMKLSPAEARAYTLYQSGALKGFLEAHGMKLQHVKPHGA